MCPGSRVTCPLSPVTCHLSPVECRNIYIFLFLKNKTNKKIYKVVWNLLVEGRLSKGPTPSSFQCNTNRTKSICHNIVYQRRLNEIKDRLFSQIFAKQLFQISDSFMRGWCLPTFRCSISRCMCWSSVQSLNTSYLSKLLKSWFEYTV